MLQRIGSCNIIRKACDKRLHRQSLIKMSPAEARNWPGLQQTDFCKKVLPDVNFEKLRTLSTLPQRTEPRFKYGQMATERENEEMIAYFPEILHVLTRDPKYGCAPQLSEHVAKMLEYNVARGKKNRYYMQVEAYKMLESPELLTLENIRQANIVGWCMEMFGVFLLIVDDIVDVSTTRRGIPCWYKMNGVGLSAVNDTVLIEEAIFKTLKKFLSNHPSYQIIRKLFLDVIVKTIEGQEMDMTCSKMGKPMLELFTEKRYNSIIKYKTAYYTFEFPVVLAMHLANKYDLEMHKRTEKLAMEFTNLFQINNDFVDCYGSDALAGNNGTDIQEGKCTWLIVNALKHATSTQRAVIKTNYGKEETEAVNAIRNVYDEIGIKQMYYSHENEVYDRIKSLITQNINGMPEKLFYKIGKRLIDFDF